jgi:hypothetical protein
MRAIAAALLGVLGVGAFEAAVACAPPAAPDPRVVRAVVAGWTMSCDPIDGRPRRASAFCGFERSAPGVRVGVEVRSAQTDVVTLTTLGQFERMTIRTEPGAAPIDMACTVSQTTCEREPVSRCPVPAERAAQLVAAMSAASDVVVALEGPSPATVPLDTAGFAEAWGRYAAMLREQRGRAVRFVEERGRSARRAAH